MQRRPFIESVLAAAGIAALARPSLAAASAPSRERDLFANLPRPRAGEWVRFIMGSGVDYQKQIGTAAETTERGELLYLETQVGTPGGSCNPNTMKRSYLEGARFPALVERAPVVANVANSGTTLTRWSDISGGQTLAAQDAKLQLLDAAYLYDDRPLHVVSQTTVALAIPVGTPYAGSGDARPAIVKSANVTHTVATFAPPYDPKHRLTRIELWSTPAVPFGIVKMRALASDIDPFELRLFAHGTRFKTDLAMSLETIRSITPSGTYVQTS